MSKLSIEKFKKELWRDQKSESTIKNYSRAVNGLFGHLSLKGKKYHFTKDDILLYLEALKVKYSCKSTINNKLNGINKYLMKSNLRKFVVKLLPNSKNKFLNDDEIFTDEEIKLILNEAKKLKNKRLYLSLRIFIQTGIRISEMEFVTYEAALAGLAIVDNKDKGRQIPIAYDLREIILDYCKERNITSGPVIITRNRERVHRSYLYRQVHRFIVKLGIAPKKAHPHTFRHKFAIDYLKAHGEESIYNLSDILGHEKVETTRIYLRKTISEIRNSMMLEKLGIKIAS